MTIIYQEVFLGRSEPIVVDHPGTDSADTVSANDIMIIGVSAQGKYFWKRGNPAPVYSDPDEMKFRITEHGKLYPTGRYAIQPQCDEGSKSCNQAIEVLLELYETCNVKRFNLIRDEH